MRRNINTQLISHVLLRCFILLLYYYSYIHLSSCLKPKLNQQMPHHQLLPPPPQAQANVDAEEAGVERRPATIVER